MRKFLISAFAALVTTAIAWPLIAKKRKQNHIPRKGSGYSSRRKGYSGA
jgi:hypothetical protein